MVFFLDENFPLCAISILKDLGHDVIRTLEVFPSGEFDEKLFKYSQTKKAIFLTTDKDFYHTIPLKFSVKGSKIVVIALSKPNSISIINRLRDFLLSVNFEVEKDGVFLVSDTKIIRRRAL